MANNTGLFSCHHENRVLLSLFKDGKPAARAVEVYDQVNCPSRLGPCEQMKESGNDSSQPVVDLEGQAVSLHQHDEKSDAIESRISRLSHFTSTLTRELMKVNQMHFNSSDADNSLMSREGSRKVKHRRTASKSSKKLSKQRTTSASGPRNRTAAPDEEPSKIKRTAKKTRAKQSSSADPQRPLDENEAPLEVEMEEEQKPPKPGSTLNINTCPKQYRESNLHQVFNSTQGRQSSSEVNNNVFSNGRSPRSNPRGTAGGYDAFGDAAVKVEPPSTFQPLRSASKYSSQERMTQMKQEFDQKLAPAQQTTA